MKLNRYVVLIYLTAMWLAFSMQHAQAATETVLVANDEDRNQNAGLIQYLETAGFKVEVVHPKQFSSFKSAKRIIVLGSPDGKDGTGEIVQEILRKDNDEYHLDLLKRTTKTLSFTKYDIWSSDQLIYLISGTKTEDIKKLGLEEKELLTAVLPFALKPKHMELDTFKAVIGGHKAAAILDVRSPQEYKKMHFNNAIFVPYNQILMNISKLDKNREIIVHCHTNRRSAIVSQILVNRGFTNVTMMSAGINGWWENYGYDSLMSESGVKHNFIQDLTEMPVYSLQKLGFFELNFLKNAIYAANGYKFASDRPWLVFYFCEGDTSHRLAVAPSNHKWLFSEYKFPPCGSGGNINSTHSQILAKLRVALIRKIRAFDNIEMADEQLKKEMEEQSRKLSDLLMELNKDEDDALARPELPFSFEMLTESLYRELHGYNRLLIVANNYEKIDYMELLGVYAGDLLLLKELIEAKNGKQVKGVLGWEVNEILSGDKNYNKDAKPEKLSIQAQVALQMIDEIILKLQRSKMNDIPEALRKRPDMQLSPYEAGAC